MQDFIKQVTRETDALQSRRKKLTDMYLDDKITETVIRKSLRNLRRN